MIPLLETLMLVPRVNPIQSSLCGTGVGAWPDGYHDICSIWQFFGLLMQKIIGLYRYDAFANPKGHIIRHTLAAPCATFRWRRLWFSREFEVPTPLPAAHCDFRVWGGIKYDTWLMREKDSRMGVEWRPPISVGIQAIWIRLAFRILTNDEGSYCPPWRHIFSLTNQSLCIKWHVRGCFVICRIFYSWLIFSFRRGYKGGGLHIH